MVRGSCLCGGIRFEITGPPLSLANAASTNENPGPSPGAVASPWPVSRNLNASTNVSGAAPRGRDPRPATPPRHRTGV